MRAVLSRLDDPVEDVVRTAMYALLGVPPRACCTNAILRAADRASANLFGASLALLGHYAAVFDAALTQLLLQLAKPATDMKLRVEVEDHALFRAAQEDRQRVVAAMADFDEEARARLHAKLERAAPAEYAITLQALFIELDGNDPARAAAACACIDARLLGEPELRLRLVALLSSTSIELRREATLALGKLVRWHGIDDEVLAAIPRLADNVTDADCLLACYSAWVLERLGPIARDAIPQVEAASRSSDGFVREAAFGALGRMRGDSPSMWLPRDCW